MFLFILVGLLFSFFFLSTKKVSRKKENIYCIAYILSISIIVALRSRVDTPDTAVYLDYYEQIIPCDFESFIFYKFEIGFQFFTHIFKFIIGYNSFLYLFTFAIIIALLVYKSSQRIISNTIIVDYNTTFKQFYLFSLIFFFSYYGLFYSAIAIRAGIVMALYIYILSILSVPYCKRKLFYLIPTIIIIGCLFHVSMILTIPLILVFQAPALRRNNYLFILIISFFLFFSRVNLLLIDFISGILHSILSSNIFKEEGLDKFILYIDVLNERELGLSFKYMLQLVLGLLFIVYGDFHMRVYTKFLNVYIIGIFLGALLAPISMSYRVLDFFYVPMFILYTLIYSRLRFSYKSFSFAFFVLSFQLLLFARII